jgi:hypothetical protein
MTTTEVFMVEDATDSSDTAAPRPVIHEGPAYFPALEAFRTVSIAHPERRYILSVLEPYVRVRMLGASDTDNVIRRAAGLLPVWDVPAATYAEAHGTR